MGSRNRSWTTMNLLNSSVIIRSVMIPAITIHPRLLLPHHTVGSRIAPTPRPRVNDGVVIAIRGIGSSRIHRRSGRDVSRLGHTPIQRVPGTVLGSVPGSVRIVFFNDGRLLLNHLRLGARTSHGGAEEDVDDEHDQEEDSESDAEVKEPERLDPSDGRYGGQWGGSWIHDVDGIRGHETTFGFGYVPTDGPTLSEEGVVIAISLSAPTLVIKKIILMSGTCGVFRNMIDMACSFKHERTG